MRKDTPKTCLMHYVVTIRLKTFDGCEFLLYNVKYVHKMRQNLMFIIIFYNLVGCTRVEHGVLKIL